MDLSRALSIISEAPEAGEESSKSSRYSTLHSLKWPSKVESQLEHISEDEEDASPHPRNSRASFTTKPTHKELEENINDINDARGVRSTSVFSIDEELEKLLKSRIVADGKCSCSCATF